MKKCTKCGIEKDENQFYKKSEICRSCAIKKGIKQLSDEANNGRLITIPEISKLFKVCRTTVYNWTKDGKLTKDKYKNLVFYNRDEILKYLETIKPMVERVAK